MLPRPPGALLPLVALFFALARPAFPAPEPAVAALPYRWDNVTIGGGGFVTGLLFHPAIPTLAYARTDVGGAYRWDRVAGKWIPLNDDIGAKDSELLGVLSFAIDPKNPDRLFLACGQYLPEWGRTGAVLRSFDRGATWQRTELPVKLGGNMDGRSAGERLRVDPADASHLVLGTNQDGLWESRDTGATWHRVASFPQTSVTFTLFIPDSSRRPGLLVGTADATGSHLWFSAEAVGSWTSLKDPAGGLIPYSAAQGNDEVYITWVDNVGPNGVAKGALWRWSLKDDVWTPLAPPRGQGGYAGVDVSIQDPTTVVVSTLDRWEGGDQVFLSNDAGATWKSIIRGSTRDNSSAPWTADSHIHWIGSVAIDPFTKTHVLFTTGYGLYESVTPPTPETWAWRFHCEGLEETVPLGVAALPGERALVSVIGDFDGFRHPSLDRSPEAGRLLPSMGTTRGIDYAGANPDVVARLGEHVLQISYDAGVHWAYLPPPPYSWTGHGSLGVFADGQRVLWASPEGTAFTYDRADGHWKAAHGLPTLPKGPVSAATDRVDSKIATIYHAATGTLWETRDQGLHFKAIAKGLPVGGHELKARPERSGELWLTLRDHGLLRSLDGGRNFTRIARVESAVVCGFGAPAEPGLEPALFFLGTYGGVEGIFRSDDSGNSWVRINDDAHRFGSAQVISGDPKHPGRVYIGTSGRGLIFGEPK